MLATIGIMVGGYILTRMIDIGARESSGASVRVFCVLTFALTVFCLVDIFNAATSGINAIR